MKIAQEGELEVVASYQDGDEAYEIDHLGICTPDMWGWFAVYRRGEQVAEFAIEESMLRPECRPVEVPMSDAELVSLARAAVSEWIGT